MRHLLSRRDRRVADGNKPVVLVWRSLWVPPSETFVRDHIEHLQRWDALKLGLYRDADNIAQEPDRAPFARTAAGRRLAFLSARVGYAGLFDWQILRSRPRLVHAHFGTGAVEVLPIAKRHRLPLVVTFHGHDVNRAPREDSNGRYLSRLDRVFDYADALLPVSMFIAQRLAELGAPQDKISVHHLGVPVPRVLADPFRPRLGVTFVGRLTRQKGVDDLLRAYALLPPGLRERTPLRIVGDGPERSSLERLAGQVDGGDIAFLGRRDSGWIADLLARSAIFVGPSKAVPEGDAEAFGLALIEASLAGAAVVSYDYAGVPEAVVAGRTGLLAPLGDVPALAACMTALLTDRARSQRLGAAGQARVVKEFDVRGQTAALEHLYDVVSRRTQRRVWPGSPQGDV